jgi:hypothetical protein
VTPRHLSRRAFLAASGGLLAAATLPRVALAHDEEMLGEEVSPLVLSSDLYASPDPQRVVFGLGSEKGYVSGPPVRAGFVRPGTTEGEVELSKTRFYKAGLPEGRGVYVAEAVLDSPGVWSAFAAVQDLGMEFFIEVNETAAAPLPGAAASTAPSPTRADRLDVDPICTRRPRCDLHDVSLSDVIASGSPAAVLFATPARCQSAYCGPVLDTLLKVRRRYPDLTFVHVEIYQHNETTDLISTVSAWNLPSEPWLFTVDGAGTIVERLDGAFGKQEMIQLLDEIA